jgi:hypothetical protein
MRERDSFASRIPQVGKRVGSCKERGKETTSFRLKVENFASPRKKVSDKQ